MRFRRLGVPTSGTFLSSHAEQVLQVGMNLSRIGSIHSCCCVLRTGEKFTSASVKHQETESKFQWFADRLERERQPRARGGLEWTEKSESGTAIMFFDLRNQPVRLSPL